MIPQKVSRGNRDFDKVQAVFKSFTLLKKDFFFSYFQYYYILTPCWCATVSCHLQKTKEIFFMVCTTIHAKNILIRKKLVIAFPKHHECTLRRKLNSFLTVT